MSYTVDRYEAAKLLNCSTRTIDRYVHSGKLRSKRVGKKIYIHDEDIHIIKNGGLQEDYIILDENGQMVSSREESSFTRRPIMVDYKQLFADAQKSVERKDALIQELSYRVGQAESELKNSISMIEYKKATMLLESSKMYNEGEKKELHKKVEGLEEMIEKGNTLNIALMTAVCFLLVLSMLLWFFSL